MAISQNINILIVDDIKGQITTTKDVLSKTGLKNVNNAVSVKEAMERIQEGEDTKDPVKLIICSNDMQGESGIDLYRKIKEKYPDKKIPFLLLTTQSAQEKIIEAAKCGIKHILLRPFAPQGLINELAKMLN